MQDFILTLVDLPTKAVGNMETLFAQANGFIGVRASYPFVTEESTPGSFVNGFYESHDIIYGENAYGYAKEHETMVKLFDFRSLDVQVDGQVFDRLVSEKRELNMAQGILQESFVYENATGQQLQIDLESFTSHAERDTYAQRWTLTALNFSGQVSLKKAAHHIAAKSDEDFDPRIREASADLIFEGNRLLTRHSGLSLYFDFTSVEQVLDVVQGQSVTFDSFYRLSRENHFQAVDYDDLKTQQIAIFDEFWQVSDIVIEGDEVLQKGIRFNLYHLFNSAGRDGLTNFGAKGLTGEGYEGHYFWDTEMYLLPFFIFTQPEIAKSLLTYRLNKLPLAQERAAELNFKGALFPWRGISGRETSAYYPAGTAQFHINGDIAYAFALYEKVTGDTGFIKEAKELIYETARFWLSFGFFSKRGFEIHEVTGPDEYTALVNNNYYTNKMAQHNLTYAAQLAERFGEYAQEAADWQKAADDMYLGFDAERLLTKQDDTSLDKQVWDFAGTPAENYPLLLHYHPIKIYKHQVLKQADTLLAHMLYPVSLEQQERDFDYYEPLTTHDSSLSKAIHGIIASRLGRDEVAYNFFADSGIMDMADGQGNASHGIHAANMGGSWLGLVYGFAGLHFENDRPVFRNQLPAHIKKMTFKIKVKGQLESYSLTQEERNV
ncbi:glycoside hydrolase family 65 protein [Streptococcus sp. 20-1249]|uniref:glycoside hydrolase family 65 protein n=1 Tax=Streptococcus hepaticus TaxID=3349163 RepID=UPI003749F672